MVSVLSLWLLLSFHQLCIARPREPFCTQFDFQEKLLEKTVRCEHKLDVYDERLQAWEARISNKFDDLKDFKHKLEQISENFDRALEEKENEFDAAIVQGLKKQELALQTLKGTGRAPTVVFLAQEVSDFDVDVGKVLKFTTPVTNEGGAYDTGTGMFTAPIDGSYIFSTTVCSKSARWVIVKLMAGNKAIGSTALYNGDAYGSCTSTSAMVILSKGGKVSVEGAYIRTNALYSDDYSGFPTVPSFSGMLVHPGAS